MEQSNIREDVKGVRCILGHAGFQIVATMNPGGDFGKRELSPALRNRLVEIWCPSISSRQDVIALIESHLGQEITSQIQATILTFIEWYDLQQISRTVPFTTRDLVAWMTFIKDSAGNTGFSKNCCSIIHGICLVIIDGLATVLRGEALTNFVLEVKQLFEKNMSNHGQCDCFDWILPSGGSTCHVLIDENQFSIGPFSISKQDSNPYSGNFQFQSETVTKNALKLLRGLQ
jgi:midasin